ncbi:GL16610 [Drosophila persimilis]|uniref:GL16610 n=1 Tax=Drosophila persimilis TaxID=7234 RepID=B4GWT4_DROPE|nr:GL16610 [Drosophila persimilis]
MGRLSKVLATVGGRGSRHQASFGILHLVIAPGYGPGSRPPPSGSPPAPPWKELAFVARRRTIGTPVPPPLPPSSASNAGMPIVLACILARALSLALALALALPLPLALGPGLHLGNPHKALGCTHNYEKGRRRRTRWMDGWSVRRPHAEDLGPLLIEILEEESGALALDLNDTSVVSQRGEDASSCHMQSGCDRGSGIGDRIDPSIRQMLLLLQQPKIDSHYHRLLGFTSPCAIVQGENMDQRPGTGDRGPRQTRQKLSL